MRTRQPLDQPDRAALQKTRNCRLAGIVTGTPSKAAEWQKKYALPASSVYSYDTMHEMAKNKDIDIVYVVTPNALHLPHTLAAAAAGKHVFCEKPLEISVERCQQMLDACKKAGVMLGVGYRCQFEANNLECVRLARDKVLGDVKIIDANFGFAIGDPSQWRLKRDLAGGGALMDVGIYCLQTTMMLTGEHPIWINAAEIKTDAVKFKEVDETILWQTKFPSGVVANCVSTYNGNGLAGFRAAMHARLVRPRTGVFLQRQPRPAQRQHRDQHSGGGPVRARARRLRRLRHQASVRRRCRARWGWRT